MNNENDMIQNLKDAGCDDGTIVAFITDLKEKRIADGLKLLAVHRRSLLEEIHKDQKQIDCLDYLVYNIENNKKVNV